MASGVVPTWISSTRTEGSGGRGEPVVDGFDSCFDDGGLEPVLELHPRVEHRVSVHPRMLRVDFGDVGDGFSAKALQHFFAAPRSVSGPPAIIGEHVVADDAEGFRIVDVGLLRDRRPVETSDHSAFAAVHVDSPIQLTCSPGTNRVCHLCTCSQFVSILFRVGLETICSVFRS